MFEILPRDWSLWPIFTQKWASVDMNWGFNPQPPSRQFQPECAPRTRTQAQLADSGINDWLVKLRTLHFDVNADENYPQLITFSVEYSSIEYLNHKIIKSFDAFCQIDDANASNLILIITALCNNFEHLRLTLWRPLLPYGYSYKASRTWPD